MKLKVGDKVCYVYPNRTNSKGDYYGMVLEVLKNGSCRCKWIFSNGSSYTDTTSGFPAKNLILAENGIERAVRRL